MVLVPTLGKSIVQAILATGKHEVIILSRSNPSSSSSSTTPTIYNAPIYYVDYNSVSSLTTTLHGVHTVISVLKMPEPGSIMAAHKPLLVACQANKPPRFIMSDRSIATTAHDKVDILPHKAEPLDLCTQTNNSIENTTVCSTIQVGMFMDYLAQTSARNTANGTPESRSRAASLNDELTAGLDDDLMLKYIDVSRGRVSVAVNEDGIPVEVSTTYILDIGALVAASLFLLKERTRGGVGSCVADDDAGGGVYDIEWEVCC